MTHASGETHASDVPWQRLASALSDRYRMERELGAGGMATVYLAHDIKHDRQVAIKVLRPELAAVIGAERFLSEIRTTANLQHPHILPLFDSGAADGFLFYVMPFIEGETVRDRLNRETQLPIASAVRIAIEVAAALDYAHRRGVIHRDIKPENILLHDGSALVADFGIALAASKAGGSRMTETGMSLGTPNYMSPEQAMGERTIDARSDIYALGAVTYEMLAGDPPFTGSSVQAIVAKVMTEKPSAIHTVRDTVPEHIETAVLTALAKLPADRFATAADFAAALQDSSATATGATASRRDAAPRTSVPLRARAAGVWPWVLALVAASAAAGWGVARAGRPDAQVADAPTVTSILAPAGGAFAEQRSLALTPDGRRLTFVFAAATGSRMLWVRHLDRLDAEPIAGTAGADAPFWSPDGRSLGYFANGTLTVLDANGDSRRLCPASGATGGSWGAKGIILFGHRDGLSTVSATGGPCRLIVPRDSAPQLRGVFLPDGERFLYSRGRLLDMIAAGPDGAPLATLPLRVAEFAVVPPGYIIVPSAEDFRALDAQRLDSRTFALEGPVVRVASNVRTAGGIQTFAASSSGAVAFLPSTIDRPYLEYDAIGALRDTVRVEGTWTVAARPRGAGPPLVAVAGNNAGLWLYDLDADRATRLIVRDLSGGASSAGRGPTAPVFNAAGTRLAYRVQEGARCSIVERDLATDAERRVTNTTALGNCPFPLDWSPDGLRLLVRGDTALQIITLNDQQAPQHLARPGQLWEGSFSPDGRAVAYSSDETGRAEVYVQSLPAGPPMRLSLEGGRWPAWSHGGRRLSFMTPDGRVQEVAMGGGTGSPAGTPRTRFAVPTWRRSMFDDLGTGFAIVGDGERYIVRMSPSGVAVAYVQHWPTLLRRADSTTGGWLGR